MFLLIFDIDCGSVSVFHHDRQGRFYFGNVIMFGKWWKGLKARQIIPETLAGLLVAVLDTLGLVVLVFATAVVAVDIESYQRVVAVSGW
jgi:hypothetical protein